MSLPSLNDYHLAVQNPNHSFSDASLKNATVETTPLGMPKARSGGFAVTYRLNGGARSWAVRCFHRETPDLQSRYADISAFLGRNNTTRFVGFGYQPDGIRVNGHWFPIVKMEWKSAVPLDTYLDKHHRDTLNVRTLREEFIDAVTELESLGIAHGDLQHGNLLVDANHITFVDYDGMYVPGMAASTSNERGHVNYQSPLRTGSDFGPYLDRFSSMAIVLALEGVEHKPDLLGRYGSQDNLIFTAKDFVAPATSGVLNELRNIPGLRDRVDQFVLACRTPLQQLPTLSEFIGGANKITTSQAVAKVSTRSQLYQHRVVDVLDDHQIRQSMGEVIQVVGYVTDVTIRWARYGQPYAFVNFSDWRDKRFRLVVWNEVLKEFRDSSSDVTNLESMWITLVGLVQEFQGIPQIIPDSMRNFRVLTGGEKEAREMLDAASTSVSLPALPQTKSRNAQILEDLRTKNQSPKVGNYIIPTAATRAPRPSGSESATLDPRQSNREILEKLQGQLQSSPVAPTPTQYPSGHQLQTPAAPPHLQQKSFATSNAGCIIMVIILIGVLLLMAW